MPFLPNTSKERREGGWLQAPGTEAGSHHASFGEGPTLPLPPLFTPGSGECRDGILDFSEREHFLFRY